jgi:arylsulfatase A-like enzyme
MCSRRLKISLALSALLLAGCGGEQQQTALAPGDAPNVLLVTLDTTRADRFGSYGYERPTTPNFDALAMEGALFELAVGVSGCTPPAHASIMTGLYPHHHGLRVIFAGSGYRLNPALPSLATILGGAGWETGAFLSSFTVSEYFGFENGFSTWDNGMTQRAEAVPKIQEEHMSWDVEHNQRRSDQTARTAAAWIRGRRRPFYCWVHFWDPHDTKMVPPDDWIQDYALRHPQIAEHAIYDLEVAYLDENFGQLVAALKESGQYDNTIIVVISDHGQGLGDHDWPFHRLLFQEQIRLPFILKAPSVPVGTRVDDLVRSIDLVPTLVELLDLDFDTSKLDGQSLLGLVRGKSEAPRRAYAEQLNGWDYNSFVTEKRPKDAFLYSIITKDWKLIHRDDRPEESMLYRLSSDPRELTNLYGSPDGARARDELQSWLEAAAPYRREPFTGETNTEAEERLRSLGYLGGE